MAENEDLKHQIDELKSNLDLKDREAMKFADYESTKEELGRVYQQCEEYKVENQSLKKLSRENEVLKDKLSKARDEKNEGIWQVDDLKKENLTLKKDLETATKSVETLGEKNKELEAQIVDLMEKNNANFAQQFFAILFWVSNSLAYLPPDSLHPRPRADDG